jgi:methionine-rich copper-binding protein CopC
VSLGLGKWLSAAALLGVLAVAGMTPSAAFADAVLRSASPQDGAVLARVPQTVIFTFNERLQERFTSVKVTGTDGGSLAVPGSRTDGAKVSQALPRWSPVPSAPPYGR